MKRPIITLSYIKPEEFTYIKLFNNNVDLTYIENCKLAENTVAEDTIVPFSFDKYQAIRTVFTYDELVAALIELKYSLADEIALNRKAVTDKEYVAYIDYVNKCKNYAKQIQGDIFNERIIK